MSEYGDFNRKQKEYELEQEEAEFRRLNVKQDNFLSVTTKICVVIAWIVGIIGIVETVAQVYMRYHRG